MKYAAEGEITMLPLCDECVDVVRKIHNANAIASALQGCPLSPLRFEPIE